MVYKKNTGIGYSNSKNPTLPQVPIKKEVCKNCSSLSKFINELAENIKHLQKEITQLKEKIDNITNKQLP
jgi:flagellar biosynthesis chaperone FliJ